MLIENAGLNELKGSILSAAIEVHRVLGPGLLELTYKGLKLESIFRVDLVVEEVVVVEVKCVEAIAAVHKAQVISYLRLTGCPAGLLINFNVPRLVDGVKRLINPFPGQDRSK